MEKSDLESTGKEDPKGVFGANKHTCDRQIPMC